MPLRRVRARPTSCNQILYNAPQRDSGALFGLTRFEASIFYALAGHGFSRLALKSHNPTSDPWLLVSSCYSLVILLCCCCMEVSTLAHDGELARCCSRRQDLGASIR